MSLHPADLPDLPAHLRPAPLTRRPARAGPTISPAPGVVLQCARMHELCGPARHTAALWLAGATQGPVLWITPERGTGALNPDGMVQWADPGRFVFATARRDTDILWCAEEALRAGVMPLVVIELPAPPALTPVRRLHLAAAASGTAPLGLIVTPGDGGAAGVDSRWHMAPDHAPERSAWRLQRRRDRSLPPAEWRLARAARGLELRPAKADPAAPADQPAVGDQIATGHAPRGDHPSPGVSPPLR